MKKGLFAWIVNASFLFGTSHLAEAAGPEQAGVLTPSEAIRLAADDPANGVTGLFEFTVRGYGVTRFVYLNSEKDYRDPRCLTVRLSRGNAAALADRLDVSSLDDALLGKTIRVAGTARRTKIAITVEGRPTGVYYYQTHLYVDDPDRIQVLPVASG